MAGRGSLFEIVAAINLELALFAAAGFLIAGLDDLLIDMVWFGSRLTGSSRNRDQILEPRDPDRESPLAIFVPAWDEAGVIGPMLAETLRRFGDDDYRLFVGCYPNDPETIGVVRPIVAREPRLRIALCDHGGPTTKADCLNAIWRAMRADEAAAGTSFRAVVLHDAEDVVHPAELRLFRVFLDDHALVQLPVSPMIDRASPWVGGHYCDEFAEAHGKNLVVRQLLGAGLPSAGVGCAISRAMLGAIADERGGAPFDETSLTEDYELGLRIAARGGKSAFVRAIDPRDGSLIAVRALFPGRFGAAARQKSRWIMGIALMGWERLGWRGGWAEIWMRWRDRLAPVSAIVLACAYLSFALSAILVAADLAGAYSFESSPLPPMLVLALVLMLAWRLAMRALFTARVYGRREGAHAIVRAVISNLVAMEAARRAIFCYVRAHRDAPPRWDKTAHVFPVHPISDRCG